MLTLRTILVTCVAMLTLSVSALARPADDTPNVLLIISDDQAWYDYSFMGHPHIRTPHLDELASESLLFTRGYVPTSLCRPSLVSIATGLYPHEHRITGNDPVMTDRSTVRAQRARMVEISSQAPTIMKLLKTRGYRSHQSGKWWEGHPSSGGFTKGMTHGDPDRGGRHGDAGLTIGRKGLKPVLDFIDEDRESPFFLWYAPFLPHTPHNPPGRLLEKYRAEGRPLALARYYAMCEWFDETCGELLAALDERGLRENTLVVYVTDNGWIQRTPETILPSRWHFPHAPRSKRSPYDAGLRTPIFLRWPGKIDPARNEKTLVSSIDLAPTILAACGVEKDPRMTGLDLLDEKALAARKRIFGAIFTHDARDLENPTRNLMYRWCIEDRWKLILPHFPNQEDRPPELYDLASDPHETVDWSSRRSEVGLKLAREIEAWYPVGSRQKSGKKSGKASGKNAGQKSGK